MGRRHKSFKALAWGRFGALVDTSYYVCVQVVQMYSILHKKLEIVTGLLDTFPLATREIRVLDLDETTFYKIIAFMKTVFALITINPYKV
ncbi:hypothetical protein OUZ56_026114 [Daphnia magna]|uniref:Uncharacterized protein n=1 Tax=Daphnia magna TaxID=35525 RepID=A0ABQ9ZKU1_9CRUS|nr:hypothetical protein OUZ56_026114 [Daphnia magna]